MATPTFVAHITFNRTGMAPRIETFETTTKLEAFVSEMQEMPEVESISTYQITRTLNRKSVWVDAKEDGASA